MNGYKQLVMVNDKEGNVYICELDCEVGSELTCTWDSEKEAPRMFEDLLKRERNSCRKADEVWH